MTRVQIIRALYAAASKNDRKECIRLFALGQISEKVYKQVLREAQGNNQSFSGV